MVVFRLDVVGVLNNQDDYTKNRNYWKYLKTKLKKEGNELVSATNQLKLLAQDGKRYKTDVLDTEDIPSVRRNPVIADIFAQLVIWSVKVREWARLSIRL